ncbi:hypothetical protein BJ508DRAFT_306412 [Ascobolus immersus RN42]|uniref:Uncharacterized protein n=1 Tax=Ascobolus immersus RN42 TaxID=1160509 RepID=A0A3N4IBP7_ASCIM|nr:hypothetical protein BJ508DRAFT_306412 [Ascobolus immersus RN42]
MSSQTGQEFNTAQTSRTATSVGNLPLGGDVTPTPTSYENNLERFHFHQSSIQSPFSQLSPLCFLQSKGLMDDFRDWVSLHQQHADASGHPSGSLDDIIPSASSDTATVSQELGEAEHIQPIPIDEAGCRSLDRLIPLTMHTQLVQMADPRLMEPHEPVYQVGLHPNNTATMENAPRSVPFTVLQQYDFGVSEKFKVDGIYPPYRRLHQERGASSAQKIYREILLLTQEHPFATPRKPFEKLENMIRDLAISEGFDFRREPNSLLGGERWIRFIQTVIRLPWFDQRIAHHIARYEPYTDDQGVHYFRMFDRKKRFYWNILDQYLQFRALVEIEKVTNLTEKGTLSRYAISSSMNITEMPAIELQRLERIRRSAYVSYHPMYRAFDHPELFSPGSATSESVADPSGDSVMS